jgi:transposase
MTNQLKVAMKQAIWSLKERGWSNRRIARELGLHRDTVARYVRQGPPKPANPPAGSAMPRPTTPAAESPNNPCESSLLAGHEATPANLLPAAVGIGDWAAPVASGEAKQATNPPPGFFTPPTLDLTENTEQFPDFTNDGPIGENSKQATNPPPGIPPPKPAISPTNPPPGISGPTSLCEPFRKVIEDALESGLTCQRIWQDLRTEHGFTGGYDSVKRFTRGLRNTTPLPFRRIERAPGQEAQVDFGKGAPVLDDGHRRRTHVLRVILSCSRKGYSESAFQQTTENLIRLLENAFWRFGGVPATIVLDNLKAAVQQADWFDPELNPKIREFCAYYGTVILPIRPRTPRHNGKAESGVGYVKGNALKGRTFNSLAEQNQFLQDWERNVADKRIHGTTRRQVAQLFEEVERKALQPLPAERFPFFHEAERTVHLDGHVELDKAYYSVGPEYVRAKVWVRWDSRIVRIYNQRLEQITIRAKQPPGKFSTLPEHLAPEKICGVERGAAYLLKKAAAIGPFSGQWAEKMLKQRGIEGMRPLLGLLSLTHKYAAGEIEQACRIAANHGAWRLRDLRQLLQRQEQKQEQLSFLEEHPLIRSLAEYDQIVKGVFNK